ncbi:YciI family protein [Nocardia sp. BMG111209]|uniref:YciI family protein n=1 Tax=Nocardia sp. BMG111209 TaxID=1160137 RepID=UPI0003602D29|nr:YciI family protein [Nocardia sp. BMG111209]
MKQYFLGIQQPEGGTPPDNLDDIMRDLAALNDEMRAAGVWVFSAGLHAPSTATVVQARPGGEVLITDGPYVESKEYLAGFSIIRAEDLDAALVWVGRLASVIGLPIEVRPIIDE